VYGKVVEEAVLRTLAGDGHELLKEVAADLARIDLADDPRGAGIVPRNIGALLAANLFDGFHTASLAITNTMFVLLQHRDVWATLCAAPDRIAAAVAEALRLEPTVLLAKRYAGVDVLHDDVIIPAGTRISMMWGAGNHDPVAFPSPGRFDLDRSQHGATTFGGGTHSCPGRSVALMLTRVIVEAIVRAGLDLRVMSEQGDWIGNLQMAQLRSLPVQVGSTEDR
jgi:cytochrome P450